MMRKNELMEKYNKLIIRNKNAEEYFKNRTVEECLQALELFNDITVQLSRLRKEIEPLLNREMTEEEIFNGFK